VHTGVVFFFPEKSLCSGIMSSNELQFRSCSARLVSLGKFLESICFLCQDVAFKKALIVSINPSCLRELPGCGIIQSGFD
jgi:hypothetical protein